MAHYNLSPAKAGSSPTVREGLVIEREALPNGRATAPERHQPLLRRVDQLTVSPAGSERQSTYGACPCPDDCACEDVDFTVVQG